MHRASDHDPQRRIDARHGEEITADRGLYRAGHVHRRLLVLERRQHAHDLTQEHVTRGEYEIEQHERRARRDEKALRAAPHAADEAGRLLDDLLGALRLTLDISQRFDLLRRLGHLLY